MTAATLSYEYNNLESPCNVWINEDVAGSPPLELPSYLKDRIENRKRKIWETKQNLLLAEAKREAILSGRVRRLSDKADHVKKTVQDNVKQKRSLAEKTINQMNIRLKKAECKRSKRLHKISVRCKQDVADAKSKRLENIARQEEKKEERLEAIREKLAAGIARRNAELRNKMLRSVAACRWCAARRIQLWWHTMMLKVRLRQFLVTCPPELLGKQEPASYSDLRRILISRKNITASTNLLQAVYRFNQTWLRKAGPRILLTCFMIKFFPRSVLAYNGEQERELVAKGEELATTFRKLVQHPAAHYRTMYQSVCSFGTCWAEYNAALEAWKSVDIDRLVEELLTYWQQLQEVRVAMTLRAAEATDSIEIPGAEEEISDSKAVLAHVKSQEEMVIQRLRQLGGEIALSRLRDRFGESAGESDGQDDGSYSTDTNKEETDTKETNKEVTDQKEGIQSEDLTAGHPGNCADKNVTPDSSDRTPPGGSSEDEFYNDMVKMEMAHEIVMNDEFQIKKQKPPGVAGQIEATLKQVFWDVLSADIDAGNFTQCVSLLAEIRGQIEKIGTVEALSESHPFRVLIADTLDIPLIKQQIEHHTFDLKVKVEGIVNILLKLCTAARDPQIRDISQLTDTVAIFKALYNAVEKIKLDIANFYLEQAKTTIKQHSIEYERNKFEQFLQKHPSGLEKTKVWLKCVASDSPIKTMNAAYLSLLTAHPPQPETVALDQGRFVELACSLHIILLSSALQHKLSSLHPDFNEEPFLQSLHSTLLILAAPTVCEGETGEEEGGGSSHVTSRETREEEGGDSSHKKAQEAGILSEEQQQRIILKMVEICSCKVPGMEETLLHRVVTDTLKCVLSQTDTATSPDAVVKLLHSRITGYLTQISLNRKVAVPKGFELVAEDAEKCARRFAQLVDFNRRVYGPFYARILKEFES